MSREMVVNQFGGMPKAPCRIKREAPQPRAEKTEFVSSLPPPAEKAPPLPPPEPQLQTEAPQSADEQPKKRRSKPPKAEKDFPVAALECGGIIGELMQMTEQCAFARNPPMAWAGAVALLSFLMSRGYRTASGTWPAMQILGLAPSGCGKEAARDIIKLVIRELGMTKHLSQTYGSGEALEDEVLAKGKEMGIIDEFQDWLRRYSDARAGGGGNAFFGRMKSLYSEQGGYLPRRRKARGQNNGNDLPEICYHPAFVLYGTGTLQGACKAITDELANDGWFARLLIVANESDPDEKEGDAIMLLPTELLAKLRHIAGWHESPDGHTVSPLWWQLNPDARDDGKIIPINEDAKALHAECRALAASYRNPQEDGAENAMWGRAAEKMAMLEMILAVSRNPYEPTITVEEVKLAKEIVWHCTAWSLDAYERFASKNEQEELRKAILERLRQTDSHEMPRGKLLKMLRADKDDLTQALGTLEDSGCVEQIPDTTPGPGRKATIVKLTKGGA